MLSLLLDALERLSLSLSLVHHDTPYILAKVGDLYPPKPLSKSIHIYQDQVGVNGIASLGHVTTRIPRSDAKGNILTWHCLFGNQTWASDGKIPLINSWTTI
jgi:hypothetical protein